MNSIQDFKLKAKGSSLQNMQARKKQKAGLFLSLFLVMSILAGAFALALPSLEITQSESTDVKAEVNGAETNKALKIISTQADISSSNKADISTYGVDSSVKGGSDASIAVVEAQNIKQVWVKEIFSIEIEKSEKEATVSKIQDVEEKKVGFTQSWQGNGWITQASKGYQITTFWSLQKFSDANKNFDERGFGKIKIGQKTTLGLTLKERTNESFRFIVSQGNENIGELTLKKKAEFVGLLLWTGTLTVSSGDLQGTWNVELATDHFVIKPALSSEEGCSAVQKGDANMDGSVDMSDAIFINMALRGEAVLKCKNAADFNGDQNVDAKDRDDLLGHLFEGKAVPKKGGEKKTCDAVATGDANMDGAVDISDAVFIHMFTRGEATLTCYQQADANGDAKVDEKDRDYILDYLFQGGPKPVAKAQVNLQEKASFWVKVKQFFVKD